MHRDQMEHDALSAIPGVEFDMENFVNGQKSAIF